MIWEWYLKWLFWNFLGNFFLGKFIIFFYILRGTNSGKQLKIKIKINFTYFRLTFPNLIEMPTNSEDRQIRGVASNPWPPISTTLKFYRLFQISISGFVLSIFGNLWKTNTLSLWVTVIRWWNHLLWHVKI